MPRYIIKLPCDGEDFYLEWSSIVNAPVTSGMTLEEFEAYYREQYGQCGMDQLPERMERVNETGLSDGLDRDPVEDWAAFNRAGANEQQITVDEIVDKYIRQPRKDSSGCQPSTQAKS